MNGLILRLRLKAYAYCRQTTSSGNIYQDSVYLMLMGYALEDLAKCIIAFKKYNAEITDIIPFEEKLKKLEFTRNDGKKCDLTTHELEDLYSAKDLGLSVSDIEMDHLKVISTYTKWKGRYPVPKDIANVPSSPEPNFKDIANTAIDIYKKAMAEIQALHP